MSNESLLGLSLSWLSCITFEHETIRFIVQHSQQALSDYGWSRISHST